MTSAALAALLSRPIVRQVIDLLDRDGEVARLIGGAVRNTLMGLPVSDIDVATTALPDEVLRRARAAGIHCVPTGFEHGTVTLIIDNAPCEVTTLRADIATDGRHAIVRFGRSFEEDALRRDFTINALSLGRDGRVHDYAGGLADIAARRVRYIGDAIARNREDYLRILRFFRFSAVYGDGELDAEGRDAARQQRDGLATLSRERIRQEFMKLLPATRAGPIAGVMDEVGVLGQVCQTSVAPNRLSRCVALEALFALPPDPVRRLLCLAVTTPQDVEIMRQSLRLTNAEQARCLTALAALANDPPAGRSGSALRATRYRLGETACLDALIYAGAAYGCDISAEMREVLAWQPPQFALGGRDAMALGVPNGPAVGRVLRAAETAWIEAGMPESGEVQRKILHDIVVALGVSGCQTTR